MVASPGGSAVREYAGVSDWDGSLRRRASPEPKLRALGHDAPADAGEVCAAVFEGTKNDFRDAEAIAEAVQRPTMKFVATKTGSSNWICRRCIGCVRGWSAQRTGIINQIRAFMLERAIAVRQGLRFLRTELPTIAASRTDVLSPRMLHLMEGLADD